MRLYTRLIVASALSWMVLAALSTRLNAQQENAGTESTAIVLPDAPAPEISLAQAHAQSPSESPIQTGSTSATGNPPTKNSPAHKPPPQPKRILGIMPNYRAVSAGEIPPPPTSREAFKIATQNSFDYSAFVFVGITSLLAEGTNAHPQLGKGVPGYWGYYWRGSVDKTDGNYWVDWIMPTVFHQDERYFAMGEGPIAKRGVYAATRILITPDYHGKNSLNASELLGRGIAQAISLTYYPSKTQTPSGFADKYAYALMRDALTNVFREYWPDIDSHVIHRHHQVEP